MAKQVKFIFLISGILFLACNPNITNFAPTPTAKSLAENVTATPYPTYTSYPTYTPYPTHTPYPTYTPYPAQNIAPGWEITDIPIMPEAIRDETFGYFGDTLGFYLGQKIVSYEVPVSLETVQNFYQKELVAQGGKWVYTDVGEALLIIGSQPTLIQTFRRDETELTIISFGLLESQNIWVLAGFNISSDELITSLITLLGGPDVSGPSMQDIRLNAMHFTSPFLQFDHPSNWFPTRQKTFSFQSDIEEGAINIFSDPTPCANPNMECFINFTIIGGNALKVPIAIGIHPHQNEIVLDAFDTQRWGALVEISNLPPSDSKDVHQFEDLIAPDSLELIELKSVTLRDGTLALQRVYHWRQIGLSTPLVSSYTLFKRNDGIIEFRTDFTEEEWATFGSQVQETILSIEVVP